jgi:hypothetical protein
MSDIFVMKSGQQLGPFQREEIVQAVNRGDFSLNDAGWYEALDEWQPLREVLGLGRRSAAVAATPPALPPWQRPVSNFTPPPLPQSVGEITVTNIDIPFWRLVKIIFLIGLASVPAVILLYLLGALLGWIVGGVTAGLSSRP